MRTRRHSVSQTFIILFTLLVLSVCTIAPSDHTIPGRVISSTASLTQDNPNTSVGSLHYSYCEENISSVKSLYPNGRTGVTVRTGCFCLSFLQNSIIAAQLLFIASLIFRLYRQSNITKPFSVILFQHQSDGKKSDLLI